MMPHTQEAGSLQVLEVWAQQHFRNEIERAILFHAPDYFTWDDCNQIEERLLNEFKLVIANLTVELLRSTRYVHSLVDDRIGHAVNLLKRSLRQRK